MRSIITPTPDGRRFITEDPARDGDNWYAYVRNDPLRYVDPTGLAEIIAKDKSGQPILAPHDGNLKAVTHLEVVRGDRPSNLEAQRGESRFYRDEARLMIRNQILDESSAESTVTTRSRQIGADGFHAASWPVFCNAKAIRSRGQLSAVAAIPPE